MDYPEIANFEIVMDDNNRPTAAPLPLPVIVKDILSKSRGWPKAASGVLFVPDAKEGYRYLASTNELFGWLQSKAYVTFSKARGCVTKAELHSQLIRMVEQFDGVETVPHFPPMRGYYYTEPAPSAGAGLYLSEFVDFFSPAEDVDRELIYALIATSFWGAPPGKRRPFAIDSPSGTGSGKSTLAYKIAMLSGGCYDFGADMKPEQMRSDIVTPHGKQYRIALIDNVKSRLSSGTLESLITAPDLAGHALHLGFRSVPNVLTWILTMNGVSLSRDLAERFAVIHLGRPKYSPTWDRDVDRFIEKYRTELLEDVAGFFVRLPLELPSYSRWSDWEREVIARLNAPEAVLSRIKQRGGEADEDADTARGLVEYVGAQLERFGFDPDVDVVHIPTKILAGWFETATGRDVKTREVTGALKQLVSSGSLRGFRINPSRTYGRGWLWNPAGINDEADYSLQERWDEADPDRWRK